MHPPSRNAHVHVMVAAIAGLIVASPALAALPFELPFTGKGLPLRDLILMGSLVLLAVALAFKLLRKRNLDEPARDGPDMHDMRWWRKS